MAYDKLTTLRLRAIAYHRNGVSGRPFHAIAFREVQDGGWRNMIATVFDSDEMEPGEVHPHTGLVAVLDADLSAAGVVTMPEATFRADVYEPQLRQWIAQHQVELAQNLKAIDRALQAAATRPPQLEE
jgi:hypothetical protein